MNVQAASCELQNPPGIGWTLIFVESALIVSVVLIASLFL